MMKYRKISIALAVFAVMAAAQAAHTGPADSAFAPRPVPGLVLASLDIPVATKAPLPAKQPPAPAQDVPDRALEPQKGFWEHTREFFGL